MSRDEYLTSLHKAWVTGQISDEAYDAAIINADAFCDDNESID